MGKFRTFCGKEFEVAKNETHAEGIMIARTEPEERSEKNIVMSDSCNRCLAAKTEITRRFCTPDLTDTFPVTMVACMAVNTEFKEYPNVTEYNEPCSNTKEKYVFEFILQIEAAKRYLYKEIESRGATAFDHMKYLAEEIWQDLEEQEKESIQMFDAENMDCVDINVESQEELEQLITSIRLIEFEQTILE